MGTLSKEGSQELPVINSKEFEKTETLGEVVKTESPMKEWLVNYVGEQKDPTDGGVTVEMIVEAMSQEFPEFLLALAEENWIRGYRQGITDVEQGMKMAAQEQQEKKSEKGSCDGSGACVSESEIDLTEQDDD